ncbi:hypothetical protein DM02DRAFT_304087 [Periconia macrospinosa]|uniref:Uncharacterized protein n=1 Tax=Periconia macrospinosa TaxID=97972 RepID=A0A2V1DVZ5_9PLEO|nr:hypothetical protein DM02DRAFT_304087 [Periconia macrospinosa]
MLFFSASFFLREFELGYGVESFCLAFFMMTHFFLFIYIKLHRRPCCLHSYSELYIAFVIDSAFLHDIYMAFLLRHFDRLNFFSLLCSVFLLRIFHAFLHNVVERIYS